MDRRATYFDPDADWSVIPDHMHNGIYDYVMSGVRPGDFLCSIFANDFMDAAGRADIRNQHALFGYCKFLYNSVPASCKGDREAVAAWVERGGINGRTPAPIAS